LTNERDGVAHDFTRKEGVEHTEIVLPEGISADWALDRSALWNAAEFSEKRKDARVAREFEIALPHELSNEGRIAAARTFAQDLANRYGAAVDFAIHAPHEQGDIRNYHAHVMMTTRQVGEAGLGGKTYLEHKNARLLSNGMATTDMQLRDIRQSWESIANSQLQREGLDIRIDHRSHAERGLELSPTEHMGVYATQMQRKGMGVERVRLDEEAALRNAELIREKPEQVLAIITQEKSVFDRRDVAKVLHRYINDDAQTFQNAFASVMASPVLVELQVERIDEATGEVELARYSTREMVEIEHAMAVGAERMAHARSHGVDRHHVDLALRVQDDLIRARNAISLSGDSLPDEKASTGRMPAHQLPGLSDEQRFAVRHVTGPERIAAVVGYAGAGKSTMLAAAREAWERQGYRVYGAALSGKAAEGLEESSGIQSRTLASWSRSWERDRHRLDRSDVFVIDEAGMVGSRQLARFVGEAEARGAKIVLVGDHEQLQAIGAGAPFRAIAERIGHAALSDIRRQRVDWQREASVAFATHRTAEGLAVYHAHGKISLADGRDEARAEIVRDYLADRAENPAGSRVAMAHRRADVRTLNAAIRSLLQERGELVRGEEGGELTFQTNDGRREFVPGDRIVFLENSRDLGVKNGMLGTVDRVDAGRIIVQLDGRDGDSVSIPTDSYQAIDHGYATTIHKNQGATVDRAFVLASGTMDRHLTYVAMTRHRDDVRLYASQDEFIGKQVGWLVEHGAAPYEHLQGERTSYFVTLENEKGERSTTWGVGLEQAMKDARLEIGAMLALRHEGSVAVTLPDGTETHRNAWRVQAAGELVYEQLENRLSRSGVKETTLDYPRDFAERRGIAAAIGIGSEIEMPIERQTLEHGSSRRMGADLAQDLPADRGERQQRRGMFDGLKLSRSSTVEGRAQDGDDDLSPQQVEKGQPRRSMFDGLKLKPGRGSEAERPQRDAERLMPDRAERDRLSERVRPMSGYEQAVDRYARAYNAIDRQIGQDLPVLETQRQAYQTAAVELEQARAGSHMLIQSAMRYDPNTGEAMTQLSGRQRVNQLVAAMDRERALQADPNIRAERFIERWNALRSERQQLRGWQQDEARDKIESQMRGMSQSLERDPQLESVLRNRAQEMGISHIRQEQTIAREMERQLTQGRSQSLGMER
jgi:Ti-type conjugative transfer relaxase TraA